MRKAIRMLVATGLGATAMFAPIAFTATRAQAASSEYAVGTPAPEAGTGCPRDTKFGVDTEKPGLPVVLTVPVTCK